MIDAVNLVAIAILVVAGIPVLFKGVYAMTAGHPGRGVVLVMLLTWAMVKVVQL